VHSQADLMQIYYQWTVDTTITKQLLLLQMEVGYEAKQGSSGGLCLMA